MVEESTHYVMAAKQSPNCSNLYCIPGSDSISEIASSIITDVNDHDAILQFYRK